MPTQSLTHWPLAKPFVWLVWSGRLVTCVPVNQYLWIKFMSTISDSSNFPPNITGQPCLDITSFDKWLNLICQWLRIRRVTITYKQLVGSLADNHCRSSVFLFLYHWSFLKIKGSSQSLCYSQGILPGAACVKKDDPSFLDKCTAYNSFTVRVTYKRSLL